MPMIREEVQPRRAWLTTDQEMRLGPGLFWDAHMSVPAGSLIVVYGQARGWVLAKAENGAFGWLSESMVTFEDLTPCPLSWGGAQERGQGARGRG